MSKWGPKKQWTSPLSHAARLYRSLVLSILWVCPLLLVMLHPAFDQPLIASSLDYTAVWAHGPNVPQPPAAELWEFIPLSVPQLPQHSSVSGRVVEEIKEDVNLCIPRRVSESETISLSSSAWSPSTLIPQQSFWNADPIKSLLLVPLLLPLSKIKTRLLIMVYEAFLTCFPYYSGLNCHSVKYCFASNHTKLRKTLPECMVSH